MPCQDDDEEFRVVAIVLVGVVVLTLGLVVGVGIHSAGGAGARAGAPVAVLEAAPAAAPSAAPLVDDDAGVVVDNGVIKFYFASGKSDLAPGALDALGEAVSAAKAGRKLVISGFHDTTGDPAKNADLARQRAYTVRDLLKGAGVDEARIELTRPKQATGGAGANAEARRVEVTITR